MKFKNHSPIPLGELEYHSVSFLRNLEPENEDDQIWIDELIEDRVIGDLMEELKNV